jgi:hypothetical protein
MRSSWVGEGGGWASETAANVESGSQERGRTDFVARRSGSSRFSPPRDTCISGEYCPDSVISAARARA